MQGETMQTDLAPITESVLPADAWINSAAALDQHTSQSGGVKHSDLDKLMTDFIAKGGSVKEIPPGVSGEPTKFNNRVLNGSTPQSPFNISERQAHADKADADIRRRKAAEDAPTILKVAEGLKTAPTARDLRAHAGISSDKLQRILSTYFSDNDQAKPFIKRPRGEREETIRQRYPVLRKSMSLSKCAEALRVNCKELRRIVALHGLDRLIAQEVYP